MCAHPKMPVATESCCGLNTNNPTKVHVGCEYLGELVSYNSNTQRCSSITGANVCDDSGVDTNSCGECCCQVSISNSSPKDNLFLWTNASCKMQLKVQIGGLAAIVLYPEQNATVIPYVNPDRQINYISLPWPKDVLGDEIFPTMDDDCGNGTCALLQNWTCLCDANVIESLVFSEMPTRDDVLTRLKIGSFEPDYFDIGDYKILESSTDVDVYTCEALGTLQTQYSRSPMNTKKLFIFKTSNRLLQLVKMTPDSQTIPWKSETLHTSLIL
mmetsp:Transcript_11918/g.17633  ORF Transcript_11918/g.17633 Transcript_11918/m.17633 type:complete len:271 (-) Transcript_11918:1781-2593(-)